MTSYVNMPTEFFGEKGNRINILFYRAADGVAGYFWSKDFYSDAYIQTKGARSNETNVFYLNIDAAVDAADQAYATTFTKGTLSHEFQHMCNAHYFYFGGGQYKEREMDSWANEMCSTTTESLFADQYSIYVPYLNADAGTRADRRAYSRGETDFVHWDNDFTQYTTAALLGGYILSQLPEAKRPAFIQTFLKDTFSEDPTTTSYVSSQSTSTYLSSVEDLILTLQDSRVGFSDTTAGTGWVSVTGLNPTSYPAFADDWAIVMKGFINALAGKNAAYNQYLKDVTSAENKSKVPSPSIPFAPAGTTGIALKPSAFVVGKTTVPSASDLASTAISTAVSGGSQNAYVMVWNGLIPAPATINDPNNTLTATNATFSSGAILAKPEYSTPASRGFNASSFRFDRTNSRPTAAVPVSTFRPGASAPAAGRTADIAGPGNSSNPVIGTAAGGYLSCAYVEATP